MNFGQVLQGLKEGEHFNRDGWNGKDMWIHLQSPDANSKMNRPYIYMRAVNGELVPWVASQSDLLAEDWQFA